MSVKSVNALTSYGEHISTVNSSGNDWKGNGFTPDDLHTTDYTISLTAIDDAGNKAVSSPISFTVSAKWVTPKTNWACYYDASGKYIGDFFQITDWRRIIGNLYYLKELADKMYPYFPFNTMGEGKQYQDLPYANDWNAIERNLDLLIKYTYPFKIGKTRTYYAEMSAPNYVDLNRIENACLIIYQGLTSQNESLRTLPYTLGGDEFGD